MLIKLLKRIGEGKSEMAGKRIIFIPWQQDKGAAEALKAAGEWNHHAFEKERKDVVSWEDIDPTDKYEIVCWGDAAKTYVWAAADQIYIKGGHSKPGSNMMKNRSGGVPLTADRVVERVVAQFSLDNTFIGIIKLYTCNSATPGGIYNHSFGEFFVRDFKTICPQARVFGYKGTVSQEHGFTDSGGDIRKSSVFATVEKRAKEYRYSLYP
jgi:hypothetical protein